MTRFMSCDEVFNILTRAPFPNGSEEDHHVEAHLSVCHDCRELAEALRPGTDLFSEAMSVDERDLLPSYRGQRATVLQQIERCGTRPSTSLGSQVFTPEAQKSWQRSVLPILALALLLFLAVAQGPGSTDPGTRGIAKPNAAAIPSFEVCLMAGFDLPSNCLTDEAVGPVKIGNARKEPSSKTHTPTDRDVVHPMHALMACRSCHTVPAEATLYQQACCTNCHSAKMRPQEHHHPVVPKMTAACATCHM